MAITNADRSSDIHSLDLESLLYVDKGALFQHLHLRETSRLGKTNSAFSPNLQLCVVETLKVYIEHTKALRKYSSLLMPYIKPNNSVGTATVVR